ncbi:MAG: SCP2 sterol-binding domain-containing protein, partial [Polyangiaceae bacterium]
APGLNYGFERILHGEQYLELSRPLPTHARLKHKPKIKAIYDKGKNAVVVTAMTTTDAVTGEELAYNEFTSVIRGAGGWGGDRGPTVEANVAPDRAPDAVVEEKTHPNQALLYRLSGDINPLHADPSFAVGFGFQKPILHGLCSFGFATRAVINEFAGGDPRFFKSIKVRFAEVVFPGETLVTEMWKDGEKITFRTKVKERDKVVISNASVELFKEIPKPKAKSAAEPAAAAAGAASGEPISADVFEGIRAYFTKNDGEVKKIGVTYLFKLVGPDSLWTLDTKTASVSSGETAKAECTLELSDADFMLMCTGKADPMKLFMDKKLKISGNVMASQKLEFLKKIDPALVLESAKKRGGSAGAAAPAEAPAPADGGSGDVFLAIENHVQKNKADLAKIGVVYLFKITNPDSAWTVDLKGGTVTQGEAAKAECTLELSDADFMDMTSGKADPMKLFMDKKLKISGNVMASQKLDFLKKIDKDAAAKSIAAKKAAAPAPAVKPAASAAGAKANAGGIFAALGKRFAENTAMSKDLGTVAQFKITGPDAAYVVDGVTGSVKEGTEPKAAATLTISDADLTALVKGEATAQSLYQHGLLRVEGDVRVAHKLGIFKGLV